MVSLGFLRFRARPSGMSQTFSSLPFPFELFNGRPRFQGIAGVSEFIRHRLDDRGEAIDLVLDAPATRVAALQAVRTGRGQCSRQKKELHKLPLKDGMENI